MARSAIQRTLDQAAIALANEMVGGAQALLDSAVNYSKLRVQFGRTIGSFQAIKHKLADMLLDVELAKSAAYYAAQAAAVDDPEWPALASLAKAVGVGNLPAYGDRMYSASRRHRLHLGQRYASVVQARQKLRGVSRSAELSSRALDAALGSLSDE